ncbi:MAG: PASTA domain-containing protein [Acidobacteria bacterium]|nr:PASTA domain-containing protein [Acidobacteriota bacterium]
MKLKLRGEYQDCLRDLAGREVLRFAPACNTIVYRALDLIAKLLTNEPGMSGILYWAVGSGLPAWDAASPSAERGTTKLVNEIYRKRLDPERDLSYDSATHSLTVRVSFAPDEAVGTLREFGLFGGDANGWPDTGHLINYRIHAAVEKTSDNSLERRLRFTFASEAMPVPLVNLVGGLLSNRPGLRGIQYWAVGSGLPAWDTNLPPVNLQATKLENETFRKPLDTTAQINYLADAHTLIVRAAFDFDEAEGVLREFGLFGGDATDEPATGFLLNYQVHPAIVKTQLQSLEREFQLTLGSGVSVAVPELTGLSMEETARKLEEVGLALGEVREGESALAGGGEETGRVTGQEPQAGLDVAEGAKVNVEVSALPFVAVPEIRGLMPEEAATVLERRGLSLKFDEETRTEESELREGSIARQNPVAGARVGRRTAVSVVLATPFKTIVPDVSGLTAEVAGLVLDKAGLALAAAPYRAQGTETGWGKVVEQNPPAGANAPTGSSVEITLSAPHTVEVPNLIGMEPDAAVAALQAAAAVVLKELKLPHAPAGLTLGAQTLLESAENVGQIVVQRPSARTRAALFSTVDVSVATLPRSVVPNLIGLELEAAGAALKERGLGVGKVVRQENAFQSNRIFRQEPEGGKLLPTDMTVNVTLATPILVTVPNLIAHTRAVAAATLEGLRLVLGEPVVRPSALPPGSVIEQTPAAGEVVPIGTTIQVTIAASDLPVAEAGDEQAVEFGASFILDAAGSKPATGKKIVRYIWTLFD